MCYADDNLGMGVFPAFPKLSSPYFDIPSCLSTLNKWTNAHFLKMNESKTNILVFGNKNFNTSINMSTCLDSIGHITPLSRSTKLPGAHLDEDLSFDDHVSKTVSSCLLTLKNIRFIQKFLTHAAAETLIMQSLPRIFINATLLVGLTNGNLKKLQRIQNFALRTVLNLHPRSDLSQHFQNLHWLTVEQRIFFKLLTLTFKCIHYLAPAPLSSKIQLSCPLDMLHIISSFQPLSAIGKKAFSYCAPRFWNALPRDIRILPTLDSFKAQLKHHLFTNFQSFLHATNPYC